MKLLLTIFLFCSAFIAFKPIEVGESIVRRPERVTAAAAVQTANTSASSTSVVLTVSATVVDNIIIGGVFIPSTAITLSSVTDDQGNTYATTSALDNAGLRLYLFYGVQTAGGTTSITATVSSSTTLRIIGNEFSGAETTNATAFDASTTGTGTGTAVSVSTLTPAASGELIVAFGFKDAFGAWTAGSGYTNYGANTQFFQSQYKLSGASTETAPWTISSANWGEIAAAFKLVATPSITTPVLGAVGNMALNNIKTQLKKKWH